MTDDELEAAACWSDYRRDYGIQSDPMVAAHRAFLAGWKAAKEGDQSSPLR